jgi:hypothetical protein
LIFDFIFDSFDFCLILENLSTEFDFIYDIYIPKERESFWLQDAAISLFLATLVRRTHSIYEDICVPVPVGASLFFLIAMSSLKSCLFDEHHSTS